MLFGRAQRRPRSARIAFLTTKEAWGGRIVARAVGVSCQRTLSHLFSHVYRDTGVRRLTTGHTGTMSNARAWSGLSALVASSVFAFGCGVSTEEVDVLEDETSRSSDTEDTSYAEDALSAAETEALCAQIPNTKPWTQQESDALVKQVVSSFTARKRLNDSLIRSRGVGKYVGERTPLYRAIAAGNKAEGERILAASLKGGNDPKVVLAEMRPTSCIGAVYSVLGEGYAAAGRADEWKKIFACGKANGGIGTRFQGALIRNGWPAPSLAFVTDTASLPGNANERGISSRLMTMRSGGKSYFGVPMSGSDFMRDFLPSPGSRTAADKSLLRKIGTGNYLSIGTIREAYHVPMVVPAALISDEFAPAKGTASRAAWDAAKAAGEPFLLESHSARNANDLTNFEIKPFTRALSITFKDNIVYSSGTLLFSPNSTFIPGA